MNYIIKYIYNTSQCIYNHGLDDRVEDILAPHVLITSE